MEKISPADERRFAEVVRLLRDSESVLFITGAGISADSGLPTYRGIGGLYNDVNAEEELPIEVLLSGDMLRRRPEWTWKYLLQIENACRGAKPNRGHQILAEMENRFERAWVLTQNVDGFHRDAGTKNLIEIHGNLHRILCMSCSFEKIVEDYAEFTVPPRCPNCFGFLRPDVVLFGERLHEHQLAKYDTEMQRGFDLVFSIGTTSAFHYISAPVIDASQEGKPTVEINPGETDVSEFVTVKLPFGAADALEEIWKRFRAS